MKANAPTFLSGKTYKQQSDFVFINFDQLCDFVRSPIDLTTYINHNEAKLYCPWLLPSDAGSKKKNEVIAHNHFTALVVDIDEGNWELEKIVELISSYFERFAVYSTIKHCLAENGERFYNRWRVVVPLASGVDLEKWQGMQKLLTQMFKGDDCAARSQQISFLPARYKGDYEYYL